MPATVSEKYRIISKGGVGEFSVRNSDGEYVTVFSYKGWFSSSGSALAANGRIVIKTKDKWQTSFVIQRSRKNIGEIIFNWRGNIVIALADAQAHVRHFILEESSPAKWVLTDERKHVVLTMQSQTHWAKKNYEYTVEVKRKTAVPVDELLIACGYATNLNLTKVAALKA